MNWLLSVMQRTGEMFGVRARVWIGAFLGVLIITFALQPVHWKKRSSAERANATPSHGVLEVTSPVPPATNFPMPGLNQGFAKLLQQLSDPDANVRLSAILSLEQSELPNNERVSLLTGCLSDSDSRVRAHAALRLGSFRVAAIEAVPMLKQLAESDPDDVVRARVKDALYNIRMYDYSPFMRDL